MTDSICPACGNPIDYCQGHGEIGDPDGFHILEDHDNDTHSGCHLESDCRKDEPDLHIGGGTESLND